jgi:release factor glutamine methyltransferase
MPRDATAAPPVGSVDAIGSLVAEAARRLGAAGVDAPRREALRLLADLRGTRPGDLVLRSGLALDSAESARFRAAVERRARGEPAAYVTGSVGFRRLVLEVNPGVLIPRPETEGLVDRVLELGRTGVVADVGTGSGCIALSLASEGGYRSVLAVDCSRAALEVARANRDRLALGVELVLGDLTTPIRSAALDLLVANPPYVSRAEYPGLEPAVREHEPRIALESGEDGLEATRRLLEDGLRAVRPGGAIVLELAAGRAEESAAMARAWGWTGVRVDRDWFGRPRYLVASRSLT